MTSTVANEILVFKTNLQFKKDVRNVSRLLEADQRVLDWNVDQFDVDNVLRITTDSLAPGEVITIIKQAGYWCEELPD